MIVRISWPTSSTISANRNFPPRYDGRVADDFWGVLTRFHRDVVAPDIERIVDIRIQPLREEMLANFDAVFHRLDRMETEYHSFVSITNTGFIDVSRASRQPRFSEPPSR